MRQYIADGVPDRNGLLFITGKDYRYMRQVLRLTSGDMVTVRFQDGSLKNMTLCAMDDDRHCITLQLCAPLSGQNEIKKNVFDEQLERPIKYYLMQIIPRPQKMDLIIRQAVECGVSTVIPVSGEYSQEPSISSCANRGQRVERIIREARQQSGSPVSTEVLDVVSLERAIQWWQDLIHSAPECAVAFVLSERNAETCFLHQYINKDHKINNVAVVVGCEGGISPCEIDMLKQAGFIPVHFATNILRCETAALYGMAAVQSAFTELI